MYWRGNIGEGLKQTPFHYSIPSGPGYLIQKLLNDLQQSPPMSDFFTHLPTSVYCVSAIYQLAGEALGT